MFFADEFFEGGETGDHADIEHLIFFDDVHDFDSAVAELFGEVGDDDIGFLFLAIDDDRVFVIDVIVDELICRGVADVGIVDPRGGQAFVADDLGRELLLDEDLGALSA